MHRMANFNKKYLALWAMLLVANGALKAQEIFDPATLSYSLEYLGNNQVEVVVELGLEPEWHTYSLTQNNPMGPLASVLTVRDTSLYKKVGNPYSKSPMHKEFEPAFDMEVEYYETEAVFRQKVQLLKKTATIKGVFEYQVCNQERCLPPSFNEFELDVKNGYFQEKAQTVSFGAIHEQSVLPADDGGALEGEMLDPISWSFGVNYLGNNQVEVWAKPILESGWHLYANLGQDIPIPTVLEINDSLAQGAYAAMDGNTISPALGENERFIDEIFEVEVAYLSGKHTIGQKVMLRGKADRLRGTVFFQTCDDSRCLPPQEVEFSVDLGPDWYDPTASTLSSGHEDLATEGWWSIFIKGLGGGFLALLTPCVFPLIPMTVNFFMKQSGSRTKGIRNAFLYGASIIFIYTTIGFGLTKVLGADVMNQMASNITMNIIFFLVFVIFGVSFLGAFEITLPSWIANKSDQQADKGGLIGIFFMAFTLAIVSFSCTGPIIGSLLVLAAQGGNNAGPIAGMLGFSTALALPFTLFAIFPSWLANLPKSGGWLNSVKVVLGLVEFALALKFLSNVDLAYHWGLLSREVFVSLWIVIFAMIGFYLIGKLKFSHDSDLPFVSVPRVIFAIAAFSFAVYLIPGLWGAPLKLMSGLAPPRSYVEDLQWMRRGMHAGGQVAVPSSTGPGVLAGKHSDGHCPNGLPCTKDYEEALAYAKSVNKPIFLDFTGYTCVNCRKMEDNVWVDPRIDKILRNDYVVASLYVDDRQMLPKEEQKTVDLFGKEFKIRTVGNKWTYMQAMKYKTNSQPYYVLLDTEEGLLVDPVGYTPDVAAYEAFLLSGLEVYKKRHGVK